MIAGSPTSEIGQNARVVAVLPKATQHHVFLVPVGDECCSSLVLLAHDCVVPVYYEALKSIGLHMYTSFDLATIDNF